MMMQKRLNLHIFGPQGSGKGTQAKILSTKLKLINIPSGQLFRDRAKLNDEFALHLKSILDSGELIPVGIHERIIEEAIGRYPKAKGFIFDGAIRNQEQRHAFDNIWFKLNLNEPLLIVLDVSDNEAIERIEKRRTCSKCGNIAIAKKFEKIIKCLRCGGNMIQRSDDHKEAVQKRLQIYHQETSPLINFFQSKNRVILIDGALPIPQVSDQIFKALKIKHIL